MSEWLNEYEEGSFIDSRDTMNTWCTGVVISINRESKWLSVRYDGWSEKWNNKFAFTSNRIAPFRMKSELYSGQKGIAIRPWQFSALELEKTAAALKNLPSTPFEVTQLLRGTLFTLVDCLLVNDYKQASDLDLAVEFLANTIEFIVTWLKDFRKHFPLIHEAAGNADALLTSKDTAIALAWPELMFTLKRVFGLDPRTSKLLLTWSLVPSLYKFSPETDSRPRTLNYLINYFASLGGFLTILQFLQETEESQKAPFRLIHNLPVYEIRPFFTKAFDLEWSSEFKACVLRRVAEISDKELKTIEKDAVTAVLADLKNMCDTHDENWDMHELTLALRLLKCPFLEKRLKGLAEIKEIINTITDKDPQVRKRFRHLNMESLARWLIENSILNILIEENPHEEIIKRISSVFIFLAGSKQLQIDHVVLLWSNSKGKHDSLLIAVYRVLTEIASSISPAIQRVLYDKMLEINPEEYDEKFIKLLGEFCVKTEELTQAALPLMFGLCLDSSKAKVHVLAIDSFVELLRNSKEINVFKEYMTKAVKNIKNFDSVCQSMMIIIKILKIPMQQKPKEELYRLLGVESEGIMKMIILSFTETANSERKPIFSSTKNVKIRLKFWKFIITSHFYDIEIEELIDLRSAITNTALSPKASGVFSKALLKTIRMDFSSAKTAEILSRLYLGPEFSPADLTIESFEVFYELFLKVNYENRRLEIKFDDFHCRCSTDLIGYPCLIKIVFSTTNPSILSRSMKLLISLTLKISRSLIQRREEIWEDFLKTLHSFLISPQNDTQIERSLTMLMHFLENNSRREEMLSHNCAVAFRQMSENEFNKIYTNSNHCLITLRRKVAEYYKKPLQQIVLVSNNSNDRYDYLYDDIQLGRLKPPFYFIVEIVQSRQENLNPNVYFSKSQNFQESLFEMLPGLSRKNAELAWNVLNKVNLIEKYLSQIRNFTISYSEIFETISLYKLVYNLKIIQSLCGIPKWLELFTNSGIDRLIEVFLNYKCENETSSLILEYNTVMLSILSEIIHLNSNFSQELIQKTLDSVIQAANTCEESENSGDIAKNAKEIISVMSSLDFDLYILTIKNYNIDQLLLASFVNCSCKYFSTTMMTFFLKQTQKVAELNSFFLQAMLRIFDAALLKNKSESYWDLLCFYILECDSTPELEARYLSFIDILESRPNETSSKEQDTILAGLLKVLKTVMQKINIEISSRIVDLVLHKCLFEIPSANNKDAPKCKNSSTRRDAFDLLYCIYHKSLQARVQILSYLSVQYQDPRWRSSKQADWNYHPRAQEKSDTGYVGIKNLGCICYMISCIQQLFFIPNFRDTILRINKPDLPLEENLLYQVQNLYSGLKYSDKQHVNPKGLCKALKDWEGRPINVLEQMDADEFINSFMDKIETQIKGHASQDIIKELFTGQLATELIGQKGCSHKSEVNEAFITLPVQVKNKKNLLESLESFIEGEFLEGSNAYQCDHCESKVTAIRRVCIKYLPNVLFVTMRRFEFDYNTMRRLKLNDYCEFPMEINMEPYTQEGIERLEFAKEKELCASSGKDFTREIPQKKYPDDYYQFKLKGIIIHIGTADSGHYYSFIREKNTWYEFNDTLVRPIDVSEIPNEAFGGEEKFSYATQTGNTAGLKSKLKNAYILLYERSNLYVYRKEEESLIPLTLRHDALEVDFDEVKEENERYWRCKSSFSPEYFDFILKLLSEKDLQISKFGICFFLTVMIRSRDYSRIVNCVQSIREHIREDKDLSEWLLEMASYKFILKELLMDCPIVEKRRVMVGLFHSALKSVSYESQDIFFQSLLLQIDDARKPTSFNFSQYFEIIYRTIKHNPALIKKYSLHTRLMNYLTKTPQEPLTDVETKNSDIYLGYDKYKPEEKPEFNMSEFGGSLVFLVASLHLCVSELTIEQIAYMFDEGIINYFLKEANTRFGGKILGQFYATLCTNNRNYSQKLGTFLVLGIDRSNHDKHKPYMRQLFWLLAIQDTIVSERTDFIMTRYLKQIADNKNYSMATASSITFLLRTAVKIPSVKEWNLKKRNENRWLENIMTEIMNKDPKNRAENSVTLFEGVRKLTRGVFTEKDWEESDSEVIDENPALNSKVEVLDPANHRWIPCTITMSTGELLQVKNESEGINKWVESLSSTLRNCRKKI